MFARFSEKAQRVIVAAQEVARSYGMEAVDAVAMLAALVKVPDTVAARCLADAGVTQAEVEAELLGTPADEPTRKGSIPFTPPAKKSLELAFNNAKDLGHRFVGTEHILLAVIDLADPKVSAFLAEHAVTRERVVGFLASLQPGNEPSAAARGHVISVRLDEASLAKIDALVRADVFKSRSEAAHFLLKKGLLAQDRLMDQVMSRLAAIEKIQDELKQLFREEEGQA